MGCGYLECIGPQENFDEDVADAEGLWGWEHESDERRSAVLYVLWSLFIRECSTSRLHRIWPLLGISSEKGEEVREKFPHLNAIIDEADAGQS